VSPVALLGEIAASRRRTAGGGTAAYRAAVAADSPILFAPLDDPSGSFTDLSTNAFVGTGHGTLTRNQTTGLTSLGSGVLTGGSSSDFVTFPDNAALDIVGDVTYEAWIKCASGASTNRNFMTKSNDGASGGYGFWIGTANKLLVTNVGAGTTLILGSATLSVGTLYHVAFTRATNAYITYINGVQDNTASQSAAISPTTQPFTIGTWSTLFLSGLIADVAVYNTALSAARLLAHYNAGIA
jgi:hypothetical protein